ERAATSREPRNARTQRSSSRSASPNADVSSLHVAGQVWLIAAGGRNVAVQVGSEGVLVVNPGPEELAEAVLAEIGRIAPDRRIRMIVTTDGDPAHVGGAARLAAGPTPSAQRAAV